VAAGSTKRRRRQRGSIDELPSGALRVRVYSGLDPISKRRMYLTEVVPPGPRAGDLAERVRTRLQSQVDERRNPRTRATVGQLLDRWLEVLDVDQLTRRGYESKIGKHIRPLLGAVALTRLDVEVLDSFYAELRRCRDHCDRRPHIQHRTNREHRCDEHVGTPCRPANPIGCRACARACKPHVCRGLSDSTVRQVHWILSGALDRAVVWKWVAVNPAQQADKPPLPHADPKPPSSEEAAQLVEQAWSSSPDWGAFVWVNMTTGMRRGEICGLRWSHVDLDQSVLTIRRTVFIGPGGKLQEKDTKTHQQRRVVLDPETAAVLRDHHVRAQTRATAVGEPLKPDAFVFSAELDSQLALNPDTASQRYKRMATRLGINTTLKNLRHYTATELISGGVDVRTVAGRLGHGGGGATTLRVYTAWTSEADQRAARTVSGRMPARPRGVAEKPSGTNLAASQITSATDSPYREIANDLRGAIKSGALRPGDILPTAKELAGRYGVATSTAHRAISALVEEQLCDSSGRRRVIVGQPTGYGGLST
jgi:integrase